MFDDSSQIGVRVLVLKFLLHVNFVCKMDMCMHALPLGKLQCCKKTLSKKDQISLHMHSRLISA